MRTGSGPSRCGRWGRRGRCQRSSANVLAGSSVSPVRAGDGDGVVCTVRPSPHQHGLAIGQWRASAVGTNQRWNPVAMAARAAQRTQGELGAERVGDGRGASNAPRSERGIVQRATFDDQPLKPRRMKARLQTRHAVAQLAARAHREDVRLGATKGSLYVFGRNLQERCGGLAHPRGHASQVNARERRAIILACKQSGQLGNGHPVAVRELGKPHPEGLAGATPLGARCESPLLAGECSRAGVELDNRDGLAGRHRGRHCGHRCARLSDRCARQRPGARLSES